MKSDKTLNFFYQHPTMCMTTQLAHGNSHKIVIKNIEVFILLAIRQKNRELSFRETMVSCFISIWKFESFKKPFATITSLSELYFRFRRFVHLVQTKKNISINYGNSTTSWKPWRWVRLDLILSMSNINIILTWTHSQNLRAAAEAWSLKISSHGTSLKWSQKLSQSARE